MPTEKTSTSSTSSNPSTPLWTSADFAKGLARKAKRLYIESLDQDVYCKPLSARSLRDLQLFYRSAQEAQNDEEAGSDFLSQMDDLCDILSRTFCDPDGSSLATAEEWLDAPVPLIMELIQGAINLFSSTTDATDGDPAKNG